MERRSRVKAWIVGVCSAIAGVVIACLHAFFRGRRVGEANTRFEDDIAHINAAEKSGDAQRLRDLALRKSRR
jgi:hypothetical protein